MYSHTKTSPVLLLTLGALLLSTNAFGQSTDQQLIIDTANNMGGVDVIRTVENLTIRGYGHEAYQDGGSEITTEANAPEKMTNLTAYERVIDLSNNRTRVSARQYRAFVFASQAMMQGSPINQYLDAHIAFDKPDNAEPRRMSEETAQKRQMDMLSHPLLAVRAALENESTLNNRRVQDGLTLIDVLTSTNAEFTLAVNNLTGLPAWVSWVLPHENLGEVTLRAQYSAWQYKEGLQLPMSLNIVSDFHDTVMLRLHIDNYLINTEIDDLSAPSQVVNTPSPTPNYVVNAELVAEGVWHLVGNNGANSVLLEFDDHLTLFELPTNRAWSQTVIDTARRTVSSKPLTEVITSHHHFDHTGGLRVAIAEGLTVITQAGNIDWFNELAKRPVNRFPDALSNNPQALKTLAVEDHLRLSDNSMTLDIYKLIANGHMAHGVLAYLPEHKILIQGDLFAMDWEVYFWGDTYQDNITYRGLDVEKDLPVHGRLLEIAEVRRLLSEQKSNAEHLCMQVSDAGLSMPGCPLAWSE